MGFLVVDKPEGWTSHDVVDAARRWLGIRRIGHLGTLDPLATGVLPLAIREATRLAPFVDAPLATAASPSPSSSSAPLSPSSPSPLSPSASPPSPSPPPSPPSPPPPVGAKLYVGSITLGVATDTYDREGRVTSRHEGALPTADEVRAALAGFVGERQQLPPMYSSVKQRGVPLYKLARRGEEVERAPAPRADSPHPHAALRAARSWH